MTPEQLSAIDAAIEAGRKIEAIKLYREATGAGLAEAKDWVERRVPGTAADTAEAPAGAGDVDLRAIDELIRAGRTIEAIKLYREQTRAGLKAAKDFVDERAARIQSADGRRFEPEKKGGCLSSILLVIAVIAWLACR